MSRGQVKICGFTREADIEVAGEAGADWFGLVLAPSRRQVSLTRAVELARLARLERAVAVLVDAQPEQLQALFDSGFQWVQCHGRQPARLPQGLNGILACRPEEVDKALPPGWRWWLFDGPQSGSGRSFDWGTFAPPTQPFWVAGGLGPNNVATAIERLRPDGVDVSSGVESAPGEKDAAKMRDFLKRARESFESIAKR